MAIRSRRSSGDAIHPERAKSDPAGLAAKWLPASLVIILRAAITLSVGLIIFWFVGFGRKAQCGRRLRAMGLVATSEGSHQHGDDDRGQEFHEMGLVVTTGEPISPERARSHPVGTDEKGQPWPLLALISALYGSSLALRGIVWVTFRPGTAGYLYFFRAWCIFPTQPQTCRDLAPAARTRVLMLLLENLKNSNKDRSVRIRRLRPRMPPMVRE